MSISKGISADLPPHLSEIKCLILNLNVCWLYWNFIDFDFRTTMSLRCTCITLMALESRMLYPLYFHISNLQGSDDRLLEISHLRAHRHLKPLLHHRPLLPHIKITATSVHILKPKTVLQLQVSTYCYNASLDS